MKKIALCFFLLTFFSLNSNTIHLLQAVLQLTLKNRFITSTSYLIPTILKAVDLKEVNNNLLHEVMQGVVKINSAVAKHSDTLFTSYNLFQETPGYRETICRIFTDPDNAGIVKGHIYELEEAIRLHEQGEEVVALNQHIQFGPIAKEFDIITTTYLNGRNKINFYECKAIDWARYKKKRLRSQFMHQANLAKVLGATYTVVSQQPITPGNKDWFIKQNIQFQEPYHPIDRHFLSV